MVSKKTSLPGEPDGSKVWNIPFSGNLFFQTKDHHPPSDMVSQRQTMVTASSSSWFHETSPLHPLHRRWSRRAILLTSAAAATAGGVSWFTLSRRSGTSPHPTPPAHPTAMPTLSPSGTSLLTYHGHSKSVEALTWAPNGKQIASGSLEKTVHVWKVAAGDLLYLYRGHSDIIWDLAWSPDGKRMVVLQEVNRSARVGRKEHKRTHHDRAASVQTSSFPG
jgi:WD40 repeat protein